MVKSIGVNQEYVVTAGIGTGQTTFNDLYIGSDGNLAMAIDVEAVLQDCAHVAKTILGEMVLQTDLGIPNFETVWQGVPNLPQYEVAVRSALLSVPGVIEIVAFNFNTEATIDNLGYTAVIRTIYGQGAISG